MQDLSKPFVKTYRDGEWMVMETNLPNDTVGDMAFEYDYDGSQRKKWEAYMKELEENGTKGQLVYQKWSWKYDERFDKPDTKEYPLTSYKFLILNINE